jgi:hypothetical protein
MYRCLTITCFLVVFALIAKAQQPDTIKVKSRTDSLNLKQDSVTSPPFVPKAKKEKVYHPDSTHSPHKAVMHSLMIPGWGQVYNRRIWKVPIVYGGLGLLASAIIFNQNYYKQYLALSRYRNNQNPPTPSDPYYDLYTRYSAVSSQAIYDAKDGYRRNRDLSILGMLGAWGIQCIDAYIDAKFIHSYTMDNDLSFKITPGLINQPVYAASYNTSFVPTLKLTLTFP